MAARIVVVGSFNADLTATMARMPLPGETVHGRHFAIRPGGKGSNQAVAAARLGANVTFVGRIGRDLFAEYALRLWGREGIDTRYVVRDPDHATGVAPIFVDDSGENSIVVILGANLALTREDVQAAAEVISRSDVLLTQLEIEYETAGHALRLARDAGVKTILNPAPAGRLPAEVLRLADVVTPNETELAVLSDRPGPRPEEAFDSFLAAAGQTLIITRGAQGARYVRGVCTAHIPAFQVDTVDTTGAGDAFNGGLAVALAEGRELEEAITFANATAALCVTRPGTAESMPTREEVELLLSSRLR